MDVFPTPRSPITRTLSSRSPCIADARRRKRKRKKEKSNDPTARALKRRAPASSPGNTGMESGITSSQPCNPGSGVHPAAGAHVCLSVCLSAENIRDPSHTSSTVRWSLRGQCRRKSLHFQMVLEAFLGIALLSDAHNNNRNKKQ